MKQRDSITALLFLLLCWFPVLGSGVELTLSDLNGQERSLKEFQGKWVLVNYWATWCPPCVKEMPDLEKFHQAHKARDAVVLGVNVEDAEPEELRKFVDKLGVTYPILLASMDEPTPFGVLPGLPVSYLLSPEGKLVARQVGLITGEMVEQYMARKSSQPAAAD